MDVADRKGRVPLYLAVSLHIKDPEKEGGPGPTAEAEARQLEIVLALLAAGPDVERPIKGLTPLLMAATTRSPAKVVQALLAAGADVNTAGPSGVTALWAACNLCSRNGPDVGAVKALLAAGADVNAAGPLGSTALMAAVAGRFSAGVVQALLAAGADVHATSPDGQTALMMACDSKEVEVCTFQLLLAAGADVNASLPNGTTPLMLSVAKEHPCLPVVKALLDAGAQPNAVDCMGRNALSRAAGFGSVAAIGALLQAGSKVMRDPKGVSPITLAAVKGHRAALEAILTAADPEQYEGSAEAWADFRALLGRAGPRGKSAMQKVVQQEDHKVSKKRGAGGACMPSSPAMFNAR